MKRLASGNSAFTTRSILMESAIELTEIPTSVMISMSQNSIVISCKSPVEGGLITCCIIQS